MLKGGNTCIRNQMNKSIWQSFWEKRKKNKLKKKERRIFLDFISSIFCAIRYDEINSKKKKMRFLSVAGVVRSLSFVLFNKLNNTTNNKIDDKEQTIFIFSCCWIFCYFFIFSNFIFIFFFSCTFAISLLRLLFVVV